MPEVGVRELKVRASEIIHDVLERRTRYIITYRRRPVGLLIPLEEAKPVNLTSTGEPATAAWDELTRLGKGLSNEKGFGTTVNRREGRQGTTTGHSAVQ